VHSKSTLLTIITCVLSLSGCSVVAYTPVVIAAAAGQTRVSLKDDAVYAPYFERSVTLEPVDDADWSLQKFSEGRYFIALTPTPERNSLFICHLSRRQITIREVFEDKINGGVYYSATAPDCTSGDGATVEAPRNTFSLEVFKPLLKRHAENAA